MFQFRFTVGVGLISVLLAFATCVWAQPTGADASGPAWELGSYVGIARNSPGGIHLGAIPDRDHVFVGVRLAATLARWRRVTLSYAPEIVPLLRLSDTPRVQVEIPPSMSSPGQLVLEDIRSVSGAGVSPVGFEGQLAMARRMRIYASTTAGFVAFAAPAPLPDSRRFNYTFDMGGGIDYQVNAGWWLRLGYKFHHFSNAFSVESNPGVDAKVIILGVSHQFGRR